MPDCWGLWWYVQLGRRNCCLAQTCRKYTPFQYTLRIHPISTDIQIEMCVIYTIRRHNREFIPTWDTVGVFANPHASTWYFMSIFPQPRTFKFQVLSDICQEHVAAWFWRRTTVQIRFENQPRVNIVELQLLAFEPYPCTNPVANARYRVLRTHRAQWGQTLRLRLLTCPGQLRPGTSRKSPTAEPEHHPASISISVSARESIAPQKAHRLKSRGSRGNLNDKIPVQLANTCWGDRVHRRHAAQSKMPQRIQHSCREGYTLGSRPDTAVEKLYSAWIEMVHCSAVSACLMHNLYPPLNIQSG